MSALLKIACLFGLVLLQLISQSFAQDDDDDEDFRPGILATITSGNDVRTEVVAEPVLISDPATSPARPLSAEWVGSFLSRGEGPHTFHAYVQGRASLRIGDRVVLDAETTKPQWVSGPVVDLSFGDFPLKASAQLSTPDASVRFYWSSEAFPLEPLPYHALFHEDDSREIRRAVRGRDFLEAWQCGRCHADVPASADLPGPSLLTFSAGTDAQWLRERLTRQEPAEHSRMPAFGFSPSDADAVLAYLASHTQPPKLKEPSLRSNEKDATAGRRLLKSIGCLACHSWEDLGKSPLFGGGQLDAVVRYRTAGWLDQQLRDPRKLNPHSRMPVFSLSDTERRQIVLALLSSGTAARPTPLGDLVQASDLQIRRGKELVRQARCAACHQLPEEIPPVEKIAAFTAAQLNSDGSCFAEIKTTPSGRPRFQASAREFIQSWLNRCNDQPESTMSEDRAGERLLTTKNCLQCHDRNGSRGLSEITKDIVATEEEWTGQAPTLQPPSLTAVGDRLPDDVLLKGVRGELPRRMDWLRVRMPKFGHTDEESRQLARMFIARDRIADEAPATPVYPTSKGGVDPQVSFAGRELTGGKGFSCVACHQLKDYVPPKVALGTRGSDLYRLGERMRAPYFFRWTRAPLRILPGVEMPSYQRPHPTILQGDLNRQLAAIWDALHDPSFTAPTNPTVAEQYWGPSESGRPHILRDVLTISRDNKMRIYPRHLSVGFANQHSVFYDLDRGTLLAWTIGDFAQQRTQGKSWFWSPAGVTIAQNDRGYSDLFLVHRETNRVFNGDDQQTPEIRLLETAIDTETSVRWRYRVTWRHASVQPALQVEVREIWSQIPEGWERVLVCEKCPDGYELWLRDFDRIMTINGGVGTSISANRALVPTPAPGATSGRRVADDTEQEPLTVTFRSPLRASGARLNPPIPMPIVPEEVNGFPGFRGVRLPLPRSIMPTAMTCDADGRLLFTSLKGDLFRVKRSSAASTEGDTLETVAEGLAAPYGVYALEDRLLVAHKPEVLSLTDRDGDGFAERQDVVATGWGVSDDYHDWTCGIVRDSAGRFYVALGSDYTHKNRPAEASRWRGNMLRFDLSGNVESIATGLRYATGLAILPDGKLFCTDQQGVQNCFNELNYIQPGHRYGVPARLDPKDEGASDPPAIQIPHPWTRSVNGLAVWPGDRHPFSGHIIGAEYNERCLIRASIDVVDSVVQGAVYPLTRRGESGGRDELVGPLSVAFGSQGELFVGSIHDSGWLGGLNTGDIVKFTSAGELPNGIREVRASSQGFQIDFLRPVDERKASDPQRYQLSGYTRIWEGNYATPDSGRHSPKIVGVSLNADATSVELQADGLKTGHVYDISVGEIGRNESLWPATAYYTLHRRPKTTGR